jgi:pyruvate dehydrogenase E2 component (dihydrolipoamide acetyltransferase)
VADDATETARGSVERIEPTKAQRAAARRVAESKATAPHLYIATEIQVAGADLPPIVWACGVALQDFPRLNGAYRDGAFETYSRINVGVSMEGGEAPVTPTIFDADRKSAPEIGDELADLRERAGAGTLPAPDLAGGTFTVFAAASGSVHSVTGILNQGQAAALAVGPATSRPVVRDGDVVAGSALTATLSVDARMIGADEAARFLDRVRELLEAS